MMNNIPEPVQFFLEICEPEEISHMTSEFLGLSAAEQSAVVNFLEHPLVEKRLYNMRREQLGV